MFCSKDQELFGKCDYRFNQGYNTRLGEGNKNINCPLVDDGNPPSLTLMSQQLPIIFQKHSNYVNCTYPRPLPWQIYVISYSLNGPVETLVDTAYGLKQE